MDYNVGLKEADFSRRELEQGVIGEPRARRLDLSLAHSALDLHRARRASRRRRWRTSPTSTTTSPRGSRRTIRSIATTSASGTEFGGTRSLIIALEADSADRLFARETLATIEAITGDIERVDTVQRVNSLATATIVEALKSPDADEAASTFVRCSRTSRRETPPTSGSARSPTI